MFYLADNPWEVSWGLNRQPLLPVEAYDLIVIIFFFLLFTTHRVCAWIHSCVLREINVNLEFSEVVNSKLPL